MEFTRRSLLVGAGTGAVALLLASCTTPDPEPSPSPTEPDVSPTPSQDVPVPAGSVRSSWTTDPHSRGARPFVPVGSAEAERAVLATPLEGRVFFAGDALGTPIGTLYAASNDGLRAAAAVTEVAERGERAFVVGAGLAGARAARFLADAGFEVTVIEGRDRTGGRVHRVDADGWPVAPALGAWTAPADADGIIDALAEEGVGTEPLEGEAARGAEGAVDVPSMDPVRGAIDGAQSAPSDASLGAALAASGADAEEPELAAALAYLTDTTGAEPAQLSSWYPPTIPGDRVAFDGDIGEVIDRELDGLNVSLKTTVLGVAYDRDGVSLRLSTGEALSADRVVLTVPIGVLRHGSVEFDPPLPFDHRAAIDGTGSGAIETVWLRFDEQFWSVEEQIWHIVGGEAAVRTWVNLAPATGEPILVGFVGGEAAQAFAELGDGEAAQAAIDSLAPFADAPEAT